MKYPILVPNIFNHPFTYESSLNLKVGDYVLVPFGKSNITGVVWDEFEKNNNKNFKTKNVIKKLDVTPLKKNTINFLNWFAEYNLIPKGMALKLVLLSSNAVENKETQLYQIFDSKIKQNLIKLSSDQNKSLKKMNISNKKFRVHVLQGTTGSGKTLVYFEALKPLIEKGFQGLILLPEIGLTSQFEQKFLEYFGFKPAVWHSGISKKKKELIWSGVSNGKIKIIIGARSSLFLPFKKLGMIIVDEEHDQSFKQDEGITYNARDMAISRASFENIPINLITAVPSIETFENIKKGKYEVSRLNERYQNAALPNYEIINLNKTKLGTQSWLSNEVIDKVNSHLEKKDQVLFFLNRRGYSPTTVCRACGNQISCDQCDARMVEHRFINRLMCHQCGHTKAMPDKCPSCGIKGKLAVVGPGVERLAEEAQIKFPKAKISVLSSDLHGSAKSLKDEIQKISEGNTDIIIGTQLVAKGHNFPKLRLVGVIDIDIGLHGSDLRAVERTYQLVRQVSGRAGRTDNKGMALIQTYQPEHPVVEAILMGNDEDFWVSEAKQRELACMPPFGKLVGIIISSSNLSLIHI